MNRLKPEIIFLQETKMDGLEGKGIEFFKDI